MTARETELRIFTKSQQKVGISCSNKDHRMTSQVRSVLSGIFATTKEILNSWQHGGQMAYSSKVISLSNLMMTTLL